MKNELKENIHKLLCYILSHICFISFKQTFAFSIHGNKLLLSLLLEFQEIILQKEAVVEKYYNAVVGRG